MNIYYNFQLLLKKIKTYYYVNTEKKDKSENVYDEDRFLSLLYDKVIKNLIVVDKKVFFSTKINNNNKPNNLAQARVLLSLILLDNNNQNFYHRFYIDGLINYLLGEKTKDNLFNFNQKSWNKQDEGIATIWVLLALLESYSVNNSEKLFDEIIIITTAMHNKLYNQEKSLTHNLGDDYWCLNAVSTYAMFIARFLEKKYDKSFVSNLNYSIELCINNINEEGFFPYSEVRKGTYLLLYNPIVILTLEEALKSKYIKPSLKDEAIIKLDLVKKFIYAKQDNNGFFVEPEQVKFSRYIISNITSLIALKGFILPIEEKNILKNVRSYMVKNKLYLCKKESNEYFMGSLFEVNDVLITEVFFWYLYYKNLK